MFGKIPLAMLGLTVGGVLTTLGTIAYVTNNATLNLAGFFYGIPLILGGLALKASELKPVPFTQTTTPEILELRKQQATVTQNKIRTDITRYVYGQDIHLDNAVNYLGLGNNDEEKPTVTGIRETSINGAYALILEFDSPMVAMEAWQQKLEKMTKYFGPNVVVEVSQPEDSQIQLTLITLKTDTQ
jgi:Protein of unknown function (DUF2854)